MSCSPTRSTVLRQRLAAAGCAALLGAQLSFASATAPVPADDLIPHEELAKAVLERAGLATGPAEEVSIEEVLERSYFTLRLGVFDLAISAHETKEKKNGNDFASLAVAIVDLQARFIEWIGPDAPDLKQAQKDIKTLRSWCKRLRGDNIDNLNGKEMGDLATLLKANKKVLEAQARFGAYMAKGTPLGIDREDEFVDTFIVAPDRRAFLEILSTFGAISPQNKGVYWTADVATWTNTYYNDISVTCLEHSDPGSTTRGVFGGASMNERTPTGMEQQLTQLAGNAMLDNLYGDKIPPSLAGAFSVNLVIDIYGECNTRIDGDLRARRTEAREIFVPGGLSEGGILPKNMADSRWRGEQGKDRFLVQLQASQTAGDSKARKRQEKNGGFEIQDDRESERLVLRAPFLGGPASGRNKVPDQFWGDSLEFYRSYRTAFVYWLQTKGIKSKKDARKSFGELLTTLAQSDDHAANIESVIEEIYGRPLSADETSKKDLEGQFLLWLAKQ